MKAAIHMAWHVALLLVLAGMCGLAAAPAHATGQTSNICFGQTRHCIAPAFQAYWEQNGGLAVFGYPVSDARREVNRNTGKSYLTQWFERNRLELHPENQPPYDVLLGRLGEDRLQQLGVDWRLLPTADGPISPNCLNFPETSVTLCDDPNGAQFKTYWQTHGLKDARLTPDERSLALFGLPLTMPRMETNANGDRVLTQWFERARFEYHPNKPQEFRVLLGLLGDEVRDGARSLAGDSQAQSATYHRRITPTIHNRPNP